MLIAFKAQNVGFYAKFNDSKAAQDILNRLPLNGVVKRWGDEIYFETEVAASSEWATKEVKVGDIAYWPQAKCLCVFFGPTEASTGDKPVPASPVVIIGSTMANPGELREIKSGEPINVFVMSKSSDHSAGDLPANDNRKLTQAEIDILVKRILAEKGSSR